MKPALLVIDIQNEYLKYISDQERGTGLYFIGELVKLFREKGHRIIRVYHHDENNGPEPDSKEFQFPESVKVLEDDPCIVKQFESAFRETGLDGLLRAEGIDALFLCGLSAVGCVMATYWGAYNSGYSVFMVREAVMSHSAELTRSAMDVTEAVSPNLVQFMLEKL